MSQAQELAGKLLSQRVETYAKLEKTDPAGLGKKNQDGRTMRAMLRLMHDHEMSHLVQVQKTVAAIGARSNEVQMILAQAISARAALAAAIIGLTDEQLNTKPSPDTWSVKEIMDHVGRYDTIIPERIATQFEGPS